MGQNEVSDMNLGEMQKGSAVSFRSDADAADELYASVLMAAKHDSLMKVDDDFSYRLNYRRATID
ncbi:MAG: hypothetical protein PUE49_05380 [Eggerthellales bacterium]|nr:hypothetical protein [Eggerthellales bacterium]